MPKLVLVKFRNADGSDVQWKLDGLKGEEYGLYPIVPKRASWFLDKGRLHPVLKIRRYQLPLAPAFALTSHAAQGQTLKKGAIVDLCIGKGTNPLGSYVAMTRVTHRGKLLIYRPFQHELFAQGEKEGPRLLLQHLRGEKLIGNKLKRNTCRVADASFVASPNSKTHIRTGSGIGPIRLASAKDVLKRKKN